MRLLPKPDSLEIPLLFLLTLRDIPAGDHLLKTEKIPHSLLKRDRAPNLPISALPTRPAKTNPQSSLPSHSAEEQSQQRKRTRRQPVSLGTCVWGTLTLEKSGSLPVVEPSSCPQPRCPRPWLPVPGIPPRCRSPPTPPDYSHSAPPAWAVGARCTSGAWAASPWWPTFLCAL